MVEGKYYHAVGVVRPNNAISFYVNGELIGTAPFKTLKRPSGKSQRLYIGGDVSGNGGPEYAFKGEVVVARMYSKALSNEEVRSLYKAISSDNNSSSNNPSTGNNSKNTGGNNSGNTDGNNSGNNNSGNTGTSSVPNAPNHMLSYRGQNGKVFTFKVTGSTSGRIWGGDNNIYTDDSNIATAAVHAGLVKAGQTGTVKVTILPGQSSYSSITRNGVTSYKNNGYGGSYQLSK